MPCSCSSLLLAVVSTVASIAPLPLPSAAASAVGSIENAVQLSAATRGRRGGEKRGLRLKGDEEKKESFEPLWWQRMRFPVHGLHTGVAAHVIVCCIPRPGYADVRFVCIRVIFLIYSMVFPVSLFFTET